MAPQTKEQRSAAARKAAATRRANRLAAESREDSSWNWNWLGWVLLGIFVLGMLIWHPWSPIPAVPATETPVVETEAPAVETTEVPTEEKEKSEAIYAPDLSVPVAPVAVTTPDPVCTYWDSNPNVTQMLKPGDVARGDVKANGVSYYDNGEGEGTVVINLSSNPVEIFAEWGSGCETITDLKYLVAKELVAGCGDPDNDGIVNGCTSVRIVTITDVGISQNFYTEVPK